MTDTTHLFSYSFDGKRYTIDVVAANAGEARLRLIEAAQNGTYDGTLVARLPAAAGWLVRAAVWLQNMWSAKP